jgi:hypothetical protein
VSASAAAIALAIPRAAWQGTRNQLSRWGVGLILLLVVGMPLALWLLADAKKALGSLAAICVVLLLGGWMALCANVMQQNHPLLARLLPGQVRRLRLTLVLVWSLLVLLGFGLSLRLVGNAAPLGLPLAALLLLLGGAMRWPLLWALMWLPGLAPVFLKWAPVAAVWGVWLGGARQQPWLTLMLTLLAGAWLLARMVQDGGPQHEQRYRKMLTWRKAFQMQRQTNLDWQPGSLFDRLQRFTRSAYLAVLARQSRQPRPGLGRAALVLGPQAHWSGHLTQLPVLLIVVLLVVSGLWFSGIMARGGDRAAQSLGHVAFGALAYLMSVLQQMRVAMVATSQEQGLLMLAPGLPRGTALNRQLALRLMGQFLLQWVLVFGLLALLLSAWPPALPALLAFALVALPTALWLWTDWSRAKIPGSLHIALFYLLPMCGGGLGMVALQQGWITPARLVLLVLGISAPLAGWRWRRSVTSPMAFPAGRRG